MLDALPRQKVQVLFWVFDHPLINLFMSRQEAVLLVYFSVQQCTSPAVADCEGICIPSVSPHSVYRCSPSCLALGMVASGLQFCPLLGCNNSCSLHVDIYTLHAFLHLLQSLSLPPSEALLSRLTSLSGLSGPVIVWLNEWMSLTSLK